MAHATFISATPCPEQTIASIARVSNPANQQSDQFASLLRYCIRHQHWSIFEHAHMTIEIRTSRAITAQILRHRSFTFQEYSQRYAVVVEQPAPPELRRQDTRNRQNSFPDLPAALVDGYTNRISGLFTEIYGLYREMIADGVAKESARFILPLAAPSTMYMTGNIRSWIHYIQLRSAHGTQKEHQDVALECRNIFIQHLPAISGALGWFPPSPTSLGSESGSLREVTRPQQDDDRPMHRATHIEPSVEKHVESLTIGAPSGIC